MQRLYGQRCSVMFSRREPADSFDDLISRQCARLLDRHVFKHFGQR